MATLNGKTIVLGVTGGIAAYKACTICSQLKQKGAELIVIMTEGATRFVQPLTFQALSRHHVYVDLFEEKDPHVISHIDVADEADLFLVAPATANLIGKLANGLADDMLSTTLLATRAPVWLAPAMNGDMYKHPAVRTNLERLMERGVHLIQPGSGMLACGYVGEGRMAEPEEIIARVEEYFSKNESSSSTASIRVEELNWWQGKRVLITAGPTQEPLDPVRFLSNHSSGKMGYELASLLVETGADVILVSGPSSLTPPSGVTLIKVKTAEEMYQAVRQEYPDVDVVIKTAAVADYRPIQTSTKKIKKNQDQLLITMEKTKDILAYLGREKKNQLLIGFAAETHDVEKYALSKLEEKNLDFIVANDVSQSDIGFHSDENEVVIYPREGKEVHIPQQSKRNVAYHILKVVAQQHG